MMHELLSPSNCVSSSYSGWFLAMVCGAGVHAAAGYLAESEEGGQIVVPHLSDQAVAWGVVNCSDRRGEAPGGGRRIGRCENGTSVPGVLGRGTGGVVAQCGVGLGGEPAYVITNTTDVHSWRFVANVVQHSRVRHGC